MLVKRDVGGLEGALKRGGRRSGGGGGGGVGEMINQVFFCSFLFVCFLFLFLFF